MELQSKFSLDDRVWTIKEESTKEWIRCTACPGWDNPVSSFIERTTVVLGNDEAYTCPECMGDGGRHVFTDKRWVLGNLLTIGLVQVKVFGSDREETYMCKETGVGSGRVYYVHKLYATELLAQLDCDIKNKALEEDDEQA